MDGPDMEGERRGWPPVAASVGQIRLEIGSDPDGEDPRHNLSAATRVGDTLFLAGDEKGSLERLTAAEPGLWSAHARFPLSDLLDLREPDEEVDIEGLAAEDGWLWVVGSHARTRRKVGRPKDGRVDLAELADLKDTRPRCLLARLPLVNDPEAPGSVRPARQDGIRHAGLLRQTKRGNALAKALRTDPLLQPFTRIPAKEGGVDVEGIAVAGNRLALGMRGPVIGTNALLLEMVVDAKASGRLTLRRAPATRLLDLEGLGIRDLKRCERDLLILAGPTTDLSGPCAIYRWRDWVLDAAGESDAVELHRPERLIDLPFGRGVDHPEGLALWDSEAGPGRRILVVCDSPAPERLDARTFLADLFDLPASESG